ncbi:hypothetical protein OG216_10030 [Streptomycetaceae bacterium NBC_01309]
MRGARCAASRAGRPERGDAAGVVGPGGVVVVGGSLKLLKLLRLFRLLRW